MAGVPLWLANIFYQSTFKNCDISHTCMNSWISLRKKKESKNMAHLAHISTWESATCVAAACFVSAGVLSSSPRPHLGLFTFLTSPTWAPVDLNLETLNYILPPTMNPTASFSFISPSTHSSVFWQY